MQSTFCNSHVYTPPQHSLTHSSTVIFPFTRPFTSLSLSISLSHASPFPPLSQHVFVWMRFDCLFKNGEFFPFAFIFLFHSSFVNIKYSWFSTRVLIFFSLSLFLPRSFWFLLTKSFIHFYCSYQTYICECVRESVSVCAVCKSMSLNIVWPVFISHLYSTLHSNGSFYFRIVHYFDVLCLLFDFPSHQGNISFTHTSSLCLFAFGSNGICMHSRTYYNITRINIGYIYSYAIHKKCSFLLLLFFSHFFLFSVIVVIADCVLYAVGKPVYHKSTNVTYGSWLKDAHSINETREKIWTTYETHHTIVFEFADKTSFRNNQANELRLKSPGFQVCVWLHAHGLDMWLVLLMRKGCFSELYWKKCGEKFHTCKVEWSRFGYSNDFRCERYFQFFHDSAKFASKSLLSHITTNDIIEI